MNDVTKYELIFVVHMLVTQIYKSGKNPLIDTTYLNLEFKL